MRGLALDNRLSRPSDRQVTRAHRSPVFPASPAGPPVVEPSLPDAVRALEQMEAFQQFQCDRSPTVDFCVDIEAVPLQHAAVTTNHLFQL